MEIEDALQDQAVVSDARVHAVATEAGATDRVRGGPVLHRAGLADLADAGRDAPVQLNPDGDPITMMTAQERRDTLALIRRLLFPALVVLGTCAAAAAMNKQHHEKPVVLTSPN
jgi:hypothetical protein